MRRLFRFAIYFTVTLSLIPYAIAQQNPSPDPRGTAATVTASASGERVRFTAPSSVVQIRLEVYNSAGRKLFDNEVRGGNVLDWHLQDGQAERLPEDAYLCLVTVKSLSGRITQKVAGLAIEKNTASLKALEASQLTAQQSEAIGPVEAQASLTILPEGEAMAATVIAHNGEEGQIIRGKGALSFRLGDFHRAKDSEQMRLTAEGFFGIGTSNPQVRLDVNGLIRAGQGIVFPDGSVQYSAARKTFGLASLMPGKAQQRQGAGAGFETDSVNISGTGTTGRIAKWQDGPSGVLSDSAIAETPCPNVFCIGIGTTPPANTPYKLEVRGHNRFIASNVSFYLTGDAGNEWVFQTVDSDKRLRIFDNSVGGMGGERLSIAASGNVGIGTTIPLAKLDVNGAARFTPGGSGGVVNIGSPGGTETGVNISSNSFRGELRSNGSLLQLVAGPNVGPPSPTNGIVINSAGNVGIGVTSPNTLYKLNVVDNSDGNGVPLSGIGATGGFSLTDRGGDGVSASGGGGTRGGNGIVSSGAAATISNGRGGDGIDARGGLSTGNTRGGTGIHASGGGAASSLLFGLAGDFEGNVEISGYLNVVGTKNFKIDHPLDPENKYLYHAAIESSEVLNVYSGNVTTDANGDALVSLPDWFEALNKDFRYQLTVIGAFAQAIVADEIKSNGFRIKSNAPNVKVSWQVTGVRNDRGLRTLGFKVEEEKSGRERGHYLQPEAFGQPEERSIRWANYPEMMPQLKQQLEAEKTRQKPPNQR